MKTALLIRNPASRRQLKAHEIEAALAEARGEGWHIELAVTQHAGHATDLARQAARAGTDVIIANGGDGTVNEVVNGIAGTETSLAVLRGGTANVWAKEIGVNKRPRTAMQQILHGERRRIDLGRAGERYFLLMCGVGFDAAIVQGIGARMKRRLGAAAYFFSGARLMLRRPTWKSAVVVDGASEDTPLYWLLAGNTRNYAGVASITRMARIDDGVLDMALMREGGVLSLAAAAVRVVVRQLHRSPNVRYQQANSIDVVAAGIPVQIDGEAHGETPLRIEAAAGALHVIVPRDYRGKLFAR